MEKNNEVIIVDNDPQFRESCAMALHEAFGLIALELPATEETITKTDWSRVSTVVTNYNERDASRLWLIMFMRKYYPKIILVGLNLEENQLRMVL